ncbi:MAG: DALR domain-containing protein, partial [Ginsengibacter sp.]
IKLTEMFSGDHPLLSQAFSPMTIRFFILQTHYRSTLDFSSEALVASEKGFKKLWEAYEVLMKIPERERVEPTDQELDTQINKWIDELEEFINDDFNTAKVLANLFEIVPVINSIKDGLILPESISSATLRRMKENFKIYLEEILGLKDDAETGEQFIGVMDLLVEIRKEAKSKKDFFTSDKIRKQLADLGIEMKDEKDGEISWTRK